MVAVASQSYYSNCSWFPADAFFVRLSVSEDHVALNAIMSDIRLKAVEVKLNQKGKECTNKIRNNFLYVLKICLLTPAHAEQETRSWCPRHGD